MATKKREIYARAAVQLRSHDRPTEAEAICPGAMGLYLFLLLQARGEQTSGDVSETVAVASWSAPTAYRRRQAEALIKVGLVERRDGRLVVVRYGDHNDTPEDIENSKAAARHRMRSVRSKTDPGSLGVQRTRGEHPIDVPISISCSISDSGSGSSPGRDPEPDRSPTPPPSAVLEVAPDSGPPSWVDPAVEAVQANTGETFDRGVVWTTYQGSREAAGRPMNAPDFRRFLGSWAANQKRDRVNEREKSRERRGRADTRQPLRDVEGATWLRPTGTESDL